MGQAESKVELIAELERRILSLREVIKMYL